MAEFIHLVRAENSTTGARLEFDKDYMGRGIYKKAMLKKYTFWWVAAAPSPPLPTKGRHHHVLSPPPTETQARGRRYFHVFYFGNHL